MKSICILVDGKKITLMDKDYLAEGGQGVIYVKNDLVFKLYHNPDEMIPEDKMTELQVLDDLDNVIVPLKDILEPKTNKRIGFVMPFVPNTEFLCKLFTQNYKNKNNITPQMIVSLVRKMQETLLELHKRGVIVGDYNEMNFLTDKKYTVPYYIDTDSYQTPSYPCTAIMDSVRDRKLPFGTFNDLSDWFSWGIVVFQLYTGIHPYKGKHKDYKPNDFEGRMTNGITVFHDDVTVPKFVNFSGIPKAHMDWFKSIFVDGERSVPPFSDGQINFSPIGNVVVDSDAKYLVELLYEVQGRILDTHWRTGAHHILTDKGFYYGDKEKLTFNHKVQDGKIIYMPDGTFVFVVKVPNHLWVIDQDKHLITDIIIGDESWGVWNNCLYVVAESGIRQFSVTQLGKIVVAPKVVGRCHRPSSELYDGVIIQKLFGKYTAMIPYAKDMCAPVDLPELTGVVLDAKAVDRWVFVIVDDGGTIKMFKFFFNKSYSKYDVRVDEDISFRNINVVQKPINSLVIMNTNDDNLELFTDSGKKVLENSPVQHHMPLVHGKTTCFVDDNKVYSVKTK